MDISIVMPCLNEARAVAFCIREARIFLKKRDLNGEIIVVDNGSCDGSADVAKRAGARVLTEKHKGYGRALRRGIRSARGDVIIFGDCDTTYDFRHLDAFYDLPTGGLADVVIGNRFGSMERGAMPVSHYIGVKVLSALGRWRYRVSVTDFHCGLRSVNREAARRMELHSAGMEFATEFIAEAARRGLRIAEVPTTLRRARCPRQSKLRTWSDGHRHLRLIIKNRREK